MRHKIRLLLTAGVLLGTVGCAYSPRHEGPSAYHHYDDHPSIGGSISIFSGTRWHDTGPAYWYRPSPPPRRVVIEHRVDPPRGDRGHPRHDPPRRDRDRSTTHGHGHGHGRDRGDDRSDRRGQGLHADRAGRRDAAPVNGDRQVRRDRAPVGDRRHVDGRRSQAPQDTGPGNRQDLRQTRPGGARGSGTPRTSTSTGQTRRPDHRQTRSSGSERLADDRTPGR